MNGISNVIAALILGGAVIWGVSTYQKSQNADGMSAKEIEAFKAQTVAEIKSSYDAKCAADVAEAEAACASDRLGAVDLGTPENPYPQPTPTDLADGDPAIDPVGSMTEDKAMVASSDSYSSDRPTAVLGASYGGGEDTKVTPEDAGVPGQKTLIDKPDSGAFYTEETRMGTNNPTAGLVDKPDSKRFYTENKRLDGTTNPTAGLVDKPDSGNFYTENTRFPKAEIGPCEIDPVTGVAKPFIDPVTGLDLCATSNTQNQYAVDIPETTYDDPCISTDGTLYTGPGTAQDPFADGDPCLLSQTFRTYTETDPCFVDEQTGMRPGYNPEDYPLGDPCVNEQVAVTVPNELPPVIPPLPPYTPVSVPNVTPEPAGWTAPWVTYTLPWVGDTYPGPMPTVRGGSDYREQECAA